jgi:two-component system, chemotaxis family, chemotaxis protein CheY
MDAMDKEVRALMSTIKVLIVDDEHYTRKVIRTLLLAIGCAKVHEAIDGQSGLDAIACIAPDIVLLEWEMPGMDGAEFVRRVRSPVSFPYPNVPIIMLTGHGERSRVLEAVRLGVHEFLLKPVSSGALQTRIVSVLAKPRNMVRRGDYYGPEPRKASSYKPEADSYRPETARYALEAERVKQAATAPAVDRPSNYVIFVN